jgi:hypothetical protein
VQIVVTDHQVLALWKEFNKSKVVKISALKVGMDRKTATKYINSKILPSEIVKDRNWKTHPDKLEAIWSKAEEFLQENSDIEGKALFEHLLETYPNDIEGNQLRTFQRRIKQWKIKHGEDQEVYFDQLTTPGRLAQLDWVVMNKIGVEINGEHFEHKLSHFTLNHSNTKSVSICRSESILSIKKGLREFLYRVVGKAPLILQVDNSSAATHRPVKNRKERVFNDEYLQILDYYGIKAQKTNVGCPNENDVVESQNGHLKSKIKQALIIRGSKSFKSIDDYECFLRNVIDKANSKRQKKFDEEFPLLNSISTKPLPEYQEEYITVRNRSTANIKKITYSVPSRLIGNKLKARIYEYKIDLYAGVDLMYSMPRVLGDRGVVINYRHIIHSLIKKPAAVESYKFREELYPTENFKKAFDHLSEENSQRQATLEYLRILKLAADNYEDDVDVAIELILSDDSLKLDSISISELVVINKVSIDDGIKLIPNLNIYDDLFLNTGEESNENSYQ